MNLIAIVLLFLVLLTAFALWQHRRVRLRQGALQHLLSGADEMERLLARTRERMRAMEGVVQRVPADIGAEARASLRPGQKVDDALRDLLEHRLWIQRHGDTASQQELDQACAAMDQARDRISTELARLERAGAELDEATEAALAAARREPPGLRRQPQ